jgi:hypothetical protein
MVPEIRNDLLSRKKINLTVKLEARKKMGEVAYLNWNGTKMNNEPFSSLTHNDDDGDNGVAEDVGGDGL